MCNAPSSSPPSSPGPSDDALRQQLQNAVTLAAKQDTIVWAVFSVFSAASVALLVALFPEGNPASPVMGMTVCATGLVAALVWVAILRRAIDYFGRYEEKMRELEARLELRGFSLAERLAGPSTRTVMITVAVAVALLWLFGLVVFAGSRCCDAVQRTPGAIVNVTAPDSTKVSVQGTVQMPEQPVWESNLASSGLSALVAIFVVFLAQSRRDRADRRRTTARLVTRIRGALEIAALTLKTVLKTKGDGTREFDPQSMHGIVLEWSRYDRVSDDIGLLKRPHLAEQIEHVLMAARRIAEAALEDQRRFNKEDDEYRQLTMAGVAPTSTREVVKEKQETQRRVRIELMKPVVDEAERVLNVLNSTWKPPSWHEQARLSETVEEGAE